MTHEHLLAYGRGTDAGFTFLSKRGRRPVGHVERRRLRVDVRLWGLSCSMDGPDDHGGGRGDDGEPDEVADGDTPTPKWSPAIPAMDHRHTQTHVADGEV